MKLDLIKTTYAELDSDARCILALRKENFFFIRFHGVLYMNKGMKNIRKITEAVRTMWQYDFMGTQEIMDELDAAFDIVKQAAGKEAADQLLKAWNEAATQSREDRAVLKAQEFIIGTMEKLSDREWLEMYAAGYDSTFVDTGLWKAYSDLYDENRDNPRYRYWNQNARRAAFVYGFNMGKNAMMSKRRIEPVCPQEVFPMETIIELLSGDKINWLDDLFEAIGYGNKEKIDRMMEGLRV